LVGARSDWNWNRGSLPVARNNEAVEGNDVEAANMALVGGGGVMWVWEKGASR